MIGFLFWTIILVFFFALGITSWKSKEAVGFFTGVKPPDIPEINIKSYNHAVATIWFTFGGLYELLGVPLLFYEQNSPVFVLIILGAMIWVIGLIIAYLLVQSHFMNK